MLNSKWNRFQDLLNNYNFLRRAISSPESALPFLNDLHDFLRVADRYSGTMLQIEKVPSEKPYEIEAFAIGRYFRLFIGPHRKEPGDWPETTYYNIYLRRVDSDKPSICFSVLEECCPTTVDDLDAPCFDLFYMQPFLTSFLKPGEQLVISRKGNVNIVPEGYHEIDQEYLVFSNSTVPAVQQNKDPELSYTLKELTDDYAIYTLKGGVFQLIFDLEYALEADETVMIPVEITSHFTRLDTEETIFVSDENDIPSSPEEIPPSFYDKRYVFELLTDLLEPDEDFDISEDGSIRVKVIDD